ncbi:hypothetical protein HK104_007474, partial [Borealophlyctis nickersoniae]
AFLIDKSLSGSLGSLDDSTTSGGSQVTLLNASSSSSLQLGDSSVHPERLLVALRAFLLVLADMEEAVGGGASQTAANSTGLTAGAVSTVGSAAGMGFVVVEGKISLPQAPYPSPERVAAATATSGISSLNEIRNRSPASRSSTSAAAINQQLPDRVLQRMGASIRDTVEKFNDLLGRVATALDNACGWNLLCDPNVAYSTSSSGTGSGSNTSFSARRGSVSDGASGSSQTTLDGKDTKPPPLEVGKDRALLHDLMRIYLDCIPRFVPSGLSPVRIIEMLSRYSMHVEESIRVSAISALMRIVKIQGDGKRFWLSGNTNDSLLGLVYRISIGTGIGLLNERFAEFVGNTSLEKEGTTALSLSILLLKAWLQELKDIAEKGEKVWGEMEAEWILEDIESRGTGSKC